MDGGKIGFNLLHTRNTAQPEHDDARCCSMFHANAPKRAARTKGSFKLKTKEDANIEGPSVATPAKNLQNLQIPCRISGPEPNGTNGTFSNVIYTFFSSFFKTDFAQRPITLAGSQRSCQPVYKH